MSEPNLGPSPAQITLMGHNIVAAIAARRARRRRQMRIAVAAGAVSLALGMTAGAVGISIAPTELQESAFTCFLTDDPRGAFANVQNFDDLSGMDAAERVTLALESCAIGFGDAGVPAPQPTACELRDLRLGVFPNSERLDAAELCTSLGLGLPPE
jgi:hypothetical protein